MGQTIQTLVDETQTPGQFEIHWDGSSNFGDKAENGIYHFLIQMNENRSIFSRIVFQGH